MTGTSSQIFNVIIPSPFLQSAKSYIIVIQLSIQSQSTTYQQSISITTMNPILTSSVQNLITNFIQDNSLPIQLSMNYNYIDNLKVDKAQFNIQWDCIDLSLLSNSCTQLLNQSLNQNIQGMQPNRMYQITFSIGFGSQVSYNTFNIILADLSNTNKNQIYQFQNDVSSFQNIYFPSFNKTIIRQNQYQPFNLVIYMLNFEVLKVDIPNTNDFVFQLQDLLNLKQKQQNEQLLLSIAIFNRKILHYNIYGFLPENNNCQFVLSSNYVEAFTDIIQLSLKNCQKNYQILVYSDFSKLQKDLSQQSVVNGCKVGDYGIQTLNLTFSNNANKQNYNQFYILGLAEDFSFQLVSSVNVIESSKISSLQSFQQISMNLLNQYDNNNNYNGNFWINNQYQHNYITYLIFLQFEYFDSKSCSQKCSINGSCQLQNVLPFNQVQRFQCQCQQNYFFYDCTASQSDIMRLLTLFVKNNNILQSINFNVQLLKILAQVQQHQQLFQFANSYGSLTYKILYQSKDFQIFVADFGCQDLADNAYNFLDHLIQYSKLFKNNPGFRNGQFGYSHQVFCSLLTGSPAYYFAKNNFCGIIKQVPNRGYYLSKMFSTNQIIVNQICETGQLQQPSFKDVTIPYYPGEYLSQDLSNTVLNVLFLKQAFSIYYLDQIKPALAYSTTFEQTNYNMTLYFDIPTFYQQNKQLTQDLNFKFQKLICIIGIDEQWQMCYENQIVIQGNSSLLKCVCNNLNTNYFEKNILFIDDYNYEFIFANEIFSYQQIAILSYLGLVLIIQIPCSIIGLMQDKKKGFKLEYFLLEGNQQQLISTRIQIQIKIPINKRNSIDNLQYYQSSTKKKKPIIKILIFAILLLKLTLLVKSTSIIH
ncbi:hypothetical protein ABPG72_004560 [Tetrahymena utriculariae]